MGCCDGSSSFVPLIVDNVTEYSRYAEPYKRYKVVIRATPQITIYTNHKYNVGDTLSNCK